MSDVREIRVTRKQGGGSAPTMGYGARDSQTGANIWMPVPVVGGQMLEGREAAEHVAARLLPEGTRLAFDRETPTTDVFLVVSA